jgi:hypothetical protein
MVPLSKVIGKLNSNKSFPRYEAVEALTFIEVAQDLYWVLFLRSTRNFREVLSYLPPPPLKSI